jgi:branched-chain amino acid transport system permease protein
VGGLSTFSGPLIGALILTGMVELLRDLDQYRLLVYGAIIILIVMLMPKGLTALGPVFRRRLASRSSS